MEGVKTEPVILPANTKSFVANGVTYNVSDTLAIARYKVFQRFQIESGFNLDFRDMMVNWRKAYDLVNAQKFADAAVLIHNVMQGIVNMDKSEVYAVRFCTLFINTPDEDISVYHLPTMDKKIEDWEAEGIAIGFFLNVSHVRIRDFLTVYSVLSQSISLTEPEKEPE